MIKAFRNWINDSVKDCIPIYRLDKIEKLEWITEYKLEYYTKHGIFYSTIKNNTYTYDYSFQDTKVTYVCLRNVNDLLDNARQQYEQDIGIRITDSEGKRVFLKKENVDYIKIVSEENVEEVMTIGWAQVRVNG